MRFGQFFPQPAETTTSLRIFNINHGLFSIRDPYFTKALLFLIVEGSKIIESKDRFKMKDSEWAMKSINNRLEVVLGLKEDRFVKKGDKTDVNAEDEVDHPMDASSKSIDEDGEFTLSAEQEFAEFTQLVCKSTWGDGKSQRILIDKYICNKTNFPHKKNIWTIFKDRRTEIIERKLGEIPDSVTQ